MNYGPDFPTAVPVYRQAEVLKITQEEALEGYWYFARVRSSKAEKYDDYVQARLAAMTTLDRLAAVALIVGEDCLEAWLAAMEQRAREIQSKGRAA